LPGGALDLDAFLDAAANLGEIADLAESIDEGSYRATWQGDAATIVPVGQRVPARQRERTDLAWWRSIADPIEIQRAYPAGTMIDGVDLDLAIRLLGWLAARPSTPLVRGIAIEGAAVALDAQREDVEVVFDALTVRSAEALRWHAAVADVALPPLFDAGDGLLLPCRAALEGWPLFFLHRELRRRAGNAYHTAAHLREAVFRDDIARAFADKRFVTSTAPIRLAREAGGLRTDIDAAVFDRKTGALAIFELKFQDPFARSADERARQRDSVIAAKRQVSAVLAWIQRHGADDLVNRIDHRVARQFHVRKVFPFVLGRYHLQLASGPPPDPRAAWGTWIDVLRVARATPFDGKATNPIATLHTRLTTGISPTLSNTARDIVVGNVTLRVDHR
jgi:hypothetical protein